MELMVMDHVTTLLPMPKLLATGATLGGCK